MFADTRSLSHRAHPSRHPGRSSPHTAHHRCLPRPGPPRSPRGSPQPQLLDDPLTQQGIDRPHALPGPTPSQDRLAIRGRWTVSVPTPVALHLPSDRGRVPAGLTTDLRPRRIRVVPQQLCTDVSLARRQPCTWHPGVSNRRRWSMSPAITLQPCTGHRKLPLLGANQLSDEGQSPRNGAATSSQWSLYSA